MRGLEEGGRTDVSVSQRTTYDKKNCKCHTYSPLEAVQTKNLDRSFLEESLRRRR